MSSHHFVRAEQADCLIVANSHISDHLFAQLLEWNPVIVATETSLEWLTLQNIKVDILLTNKPFVDFPYPIQLLPITNIMEAIQYLQNTLKGEGITIVGDSNVQPYLDYILQKGNKNMMVMEADAKYFLVTKGEQFKKHLFEGEIWHYYPEKNFHTNADVQYFKDGFKVLKDELIVIHANGNFIFKERV